ncbi:hypothetical protein BDM02DRAFT_3132882 [Thelephora ganbajun]|uniref:Uncharacterized protein n=1 Tax=Thelephora ganbajun TaxID=370292 RepID=A0ACB6YZX6_THEGA|nr:hypothetical protein BDM02DRAFT_3132882 [Thelephora ganbajun]
MQCYLISQSEVDMLLLFQVGLDQWFLWSWFRGIIDGPGLDGSGPGQGCSMIGSMEWAGVGYKPPHWLLESPSIRFSPPPNIYSPTNHLNIPTMSSFTIGASSSSANLSPHRRAMINDKHAAFMQSWNATTLAHARGTCFHPYPTPHNVFMRANTAENSDEDFSDLAINDFVSSHKVTAHRKLECLQGSVFNKLLLERGMFHAMEGIEQYNGPIKVSMGYTSAIRVMLAEEIALTNDTVGAVSVLSRSVEEHISELMETIQALETTVHHLKWSHESFKVHVELELANRDLTIGVLHARVNTLAPMEVDMLDDEEENVSPPTGNTSTTDVSTVRVRVESPDIVFDQGEVLARMEVPVGVLVPIEDVVEEEVVEPVWIQLPAASFNWQDERAQAREPYYH